MALVVSKAHKKIHRLTRILNFIHLKWFETTHKAAQICKVMRHCWQHIPNTLATFSRAFKPLINWRKKNVSTAYS